MKIRKGFVSNSSSSSYICDICGQDASGFDVDLAEYEMFECENGHVFCEDHMKNVPSMIDIIKEKVAKADPKYYQKEIDEFNQMIADNVDEDDIVDNFQDWYYEARYELPSKFCPLCQLEHLTSEDMIFYLLKRANMNKEQILEEVKKSFSSTKEMKDDEKLKVHFRKLRLNELD